MASINWKRNNQKKRTQKDMGEDYNDTKYLINSLAAEYRRARYERAKRDRRKALILQAAVKAGIFNGPIPYGPTIRSVDTPDAIRKEQTRRSTFNRLSHVKTKDKHFKKENRKWNEGNQNEEVS